MKIEIRSASEAVIEGYVNAVGRDSRMLPSPRGTFIEQVSPGTFTRALSKASNVEVRSNHTRVLGSIKDGNLKLYEDSIGLYAKATITDAETIEKARKGELRGWSFGFVVNADKWEDTEKGIQRRYLEDIELREVSILDKTPAYIATSIEMRGEDSVICEERSIEDVAEVTELEQRSIDLSTYQKQIELLTLGGY